MPIEDYLYLQGGEGEEREEGEGEEQDGGGIFRTTLDEDRRRREQALQRDLHKAHPVNIPGYGRRAGVAAISGVREFGKNAREKAINASALAKSGVSGANSFAQGAAAKTASVAAATAKAAASAPSKLASAAAAVASPPKSENDLIKERKFINIPFNDSARNFETEFKSELSDLVVKFFTVSDHTNSFEFSKIKVLKKLSSIKLYHTKLCLTEIIAALKTCNAYLFQLPLPDQTTRDAAIKQFKDKIQSVVEANFKDNFFNDNIAIHISNNNYLALQENLDNYLFIDDTSNDYSITNLHQKSILLYILQLFVIYYYPKYLLEIICKVMVENVTAISEGINELMNDGNLNNKLSDLVASLMSNYEKANALREVRQSGGVDPRFAPPVLIGILDRDDKRKAEQLSNEQIKQLVFNKYIKGVNLQDEYNKKSRKVFYNALVNFAISIILDITRNNYTHEIITKLVEFSDSRLILNEKDMNGIIDPIDTQISALETKISAQVQLIEGDDTTLTRDTLFNKYYEAATSDDEKKNIRLKILNTTSVAYPIYVEFQKLERFRAELVNMKNKKSTYKRINEVKRNMFEFDNIFEINDDIWLGRGIGTQDQQGENYHDALYNLIMTAAEESLMFSLNGPEVRLVALPPVPVLTPKSTPGPRNGPWPATSDGLQPAEFPPVVNPTEIEDLDDPYQKARLTDAALLRDAAEKEARVTNLPETIRDAIKKLEARIRELETNPPTDVVDAQVELRNTRDALDEAKKELAVALSPPAAADANDAAAAAPPPDAANAAPPPLAAPVPVPVPVPDAANAGNPVASLLGAAWQNLVGKPDQDAVQAAPGTKNAAAAARARAGNAANTGMTEEQREAARKNLNERLAANKRALEAEKAAKDAALSGASGGKRRTRRHKKRAGTRRYKKRAGTRRHKKRSGTHKKRKNRTR